MKLTPGCAAALAFVLITACGGGDESGDRGANGGRGGSLGGDGNGTGGAGGGDDMFANVSPDAGTRMPGGGDDTVGCTPKTCEELGKDCGPVADGCGGLAECGECADGSLCGIGETNVCSVLADLCEPMPVSEACAGKACGQTSDGCGNVVDCGSCGSGQGCGLFEPFACGDIPSTTADSCAAVVDSCAAAGAECGKIGNGCGNLIDCDAELGGCTGGTICGLAGPEKCGAPPACVPLAADVACAGKCGMVSNGCEPMGADTGLIDCSSVPSSQCTAGETCGGGGVPNQCGSGAGACVPLGMAQACGSALCGAASDGCGGMVQCGTCNTDEICTSGSCQALCTPTAIATACAGKDCGLVGDGCGGSYDCGSCGAGETCGLYQPFVCGQDVPSCVPADMATACAGKECGTVYDGCGTAPANEIDCSGGSGCPANEYCGIDAPFQCDPAPSQPPGCTPAASCADLGWACGMAVDDCGNVFDCSLEGRSCDPSTESCVGGINGPTACQMGSGGGGGLPPNCDVCDSVPDCSGMPQVTQLTGRVTTPGKSPGDTANQVGVPNAFVYILTNNDESQLPALDTGIPGSTGSWATACDLCDSQDLGPVLVSATTDATGAFTLSGNIPVGEEFVLVTKIGKWRRAVKYTVPGGSECSTSGVAAASTRIPSNMSDGLAVNIPRTAISTGRVDAMECVFYKMGLAESEFALPGAGGSAPQRVHMYASEDERGAVMSTGYTGDSALYGDQTRLHSYDMVVFDCEASTYHESAADDARIREYVNRGGRMFASHFSYSWINDNAGVNYSAATFYDTRLDTAANDGSGSSDSDTGYVSLYRPNANPAKIAVFGDWLQNEGAVTVSGPDLIFTIQDPRDLADSVNAPAEEWVYRIPGSDDGTCRACADLGQADCQASAAQCTWTGSACTGGGGGQSCSQFGVFECGNAPGCSLNFLLQCTGTTTGPVCNDTNLRAGCESQLGCGWDPGSDTSVQQYSFNTPFGAPDEALCGRVAYSGFHVATGSGDFQDDVFPTHCTGDLTAQEKVLLYMLFDLASCVTSGGPPVPPGCTPTDASAACSGLCGSIADGCGGVHDCGGCPAGQFCGADNLCEDAGCTPSSCAAQGATCGSVADGCGNVLDCGPCPAGQACGLVTPNQCTITCTPVDMASACAGKCGYVSDGCGGVYQCPDCGGGQVCVNNTCQSGGCTPGTCPGGLDCGVVSDGCDGVVSCGTCTAPESCGGGGVANVCGQPTCTPLTCSGLGAQCGWIGDGCGGAADCGDCPPGQACGVGGPNTCGGCTPTTCQAVGAQCGQVGDGCGGALDCGVCPDGLTCGAIDPNKCGGGPSCVPLSCGDVGAECGQIGDGCGDLDDCGTCAANEVCGIVSPNQCDPPPPCEELTCAGQDAECGMIGNGCGGLVNCGPCPPGEACGVLEPHKCASVE